MPVERRGRGFNQVDFTTLLVLLNLCGMFPGYLLFGVLADRFGHKRTLIGYLLLAALSVPDFALARQLGLILLAASVSAFFGTSFFVGSSVLDSELFRRRSALPRLFLTMWFVV